MESSEFEAAVVEYDTVTRQLATATGLELEKLVIIQRDLESFINRRQNPMSPHSQWWGWYDPGKNKFVYPQSGETIHTDIALRLFPKTQDRDDAFEAASRRGMVRFALDLTVDGITPSASDKYGVPYLLVEARDICHNADAIDRVLEAARGHSKLFNQIVVADGRGMIQNSKTIDEARQKLWEAKGNPVSRKSPWWGWYDPRKELFIYPKGKEHTHDDMAERMFPGYKDEDAAEKAGIAGMVRFGVEGTILLVDVSDLRSGRSVDAIDKVLEAARQHRSQFSKVVVQDWWSGINQESTSIDEARRKLWEGQNPKAPPRSTWDVGQAQYEAYKAGVRAGDTGLFQDWIQKSGQSRRSPTLLAALQREFDRGVMGEPWYSTPYKGAVIERLSTGEYRVSLDPESRLESFGEAVRFVDYWAKHQRNPRLDKHLSGSTRGIVLPGGKVIEQPYHHGETHEKMIKQAGYEDSLDFFLKGGVRYIRRDNGMEIELGADPRAIRHALKVAWTFQREEYFVDLWRSADDMDYAGVHSYRELERFLKKEAA